MKDKANISVQGTPIALVLTVIFVTLKLTDNIDWSWWWVLSPIWISWIVLFVFFLIAMVFVTIVNKR